MTPTEDRYQPVAFDPMAHAAKRRKADPEFRAAYDAMENEFATLSKCADACGKKLIIQMV